MGMASASTCCGDHHVCGRTVFGQHTLVLMLLAPHHCGTCSKCVTVFGAQAPSFTVNPHNKDVYSAYNKPEAVIDWLAHNEVGLRPVYS